MASDHDPLSSLQLVDWRRRVGDLYRLSGDDAARGFRAGRDELFRTHPQSPIPAGERGGFAGLNYYPYDAEYRVPAVVEALSNAEPLEVDTGGDDGVITYQRTGTLKFTLCGQPCELTLFSMTTYGGGLFIPFRDGTSGEGTYGGGRYLADTVKNTDGLGFEVSPQSVGVVLDFNYAYNPSCAYDVRWSCPLAPRENWLSVAVTAGEQTYVHS